MDKKEQIVTLASNYQSTKKEVEELKAKLKATNEELEKIEKDLKKTLPDKKWVYVDGILYGESSNDWGGHSSSLNTLTAEITKLANGDTIDDWTGKLGFHRYEGG